MMDVVTECKDELTMEEVCNNHSIYGCGDFIVSINADYCIIYFRPHVEISIRI